MTELTRRDPLNLFFCDLARVVQNRLLYPPGNEHMTKAVNKALESLAGWGKTVRIGLMGIEAIIEDQTVEEPPPVVVLMLKKFQEAGWESIRIEPDIDAEVLYEMAEALATGREGPFKGRGINAGYLCMERAKELSTPLSKAIVGYIKLLSNTQEAVTLLGEGVQEGLDAARDVVGSIAGQLATGRDIFSPIRTLKSYDEYTFTHALNVALLTMAIGKAMGADEKLLTDISLGALCHDIGKEKIPKEILNKPEKLSDEEMMLMKLHSVEGARMLLDMDRDDISPIVPVIAYEHHMKPNGTGYPSSRKPHPASMLVAVADIFDALRTVRPYRPASNIEDAYTILLEEAGFGQVEKSCLPYFGDILGVFQPGRRIELSTGEEGLVTEFCTSNPMTPKVEMESGEILDLSLENSPTITGIISTQPI